MEHPSKMVEMFVSDRHVAVKERQNSHSSSDKASERSQNAEILSAVWVAGMYLERKKINRNPEKRVTSATMF